MGTMKMGFLGLLVVIGGVLLVACTAKPKGEQVTLQILQTSDLHNRFQGFEYSTLSETKGGLSRVATVAKRLRDMNPDGTILLDTGDTFEDNFSEIFLGGTAKMEDNPMLLGLNALGVDIWVPGNHEFNFGVPILQDFSSRLNAKTLLANVYGKDGKRLFQPYTIIERQGVKIGIIGLVTPHITKWDRTNLMGYTVTSPYAEVEALLPEVREQSDIILLATHMAVPVEYGEDSTRELAQMFPEVAVVFSAHAHDTINEREGSVVLLEPAKYGEALGQIEITLTKTGDKWQVMNPAKDIKSQIITLADETEDEAILSATATAHAKALAHGGQVIGELVGGDLAYPDKVAGIAEAHIKPSPLLSLISEVALAESGADVASMALLREDANLKAGAIKLSDVSLIYKYDNALRVYSMTGRQLKKYMEWSARFFQQAKDGDLTIAFNPDIRGYNNDLFAGVKYDINISKPEGSRIENLVWIKNGEAVTDEEIVKVATTDYRGQTLFEGGIDGVFADGDAVLVRDFNDEMGSAGRIRAMIVRYIANKGGKITANVNPAVLDFTITGFNPDPAQLMELEALSAEGKIKAPKSDSGRETNVRAMTAKDIETARK